MNVWGKSFGSEHGMCHHTVTVKLKDYFNQVYNKAYRKRRKKKKVRDVKAPEEP